MNQEMTMRSCIEEQPAVMQRIFENRSENLKDLLSYYKEICPDHLYIIACGSSYNASCAAAVFMEKALDIDVTVHVPSQIPTIRAKRPLILAVSQGGESTNTIAAVKALKNYPLVAVTGKKECTVNTLCDRHFDFGCGIETVGPKTKGYTATILSFSLFALEAGYASGSLSKEDYDRYTAMFAAVPANLQENITRTDAFVEKYLDVFCAAEKIAFTGKGVGGQLAKECALKVMETLLIPSIQYEFEEYLHGPICAIDDRMIGFYMLPNDADASRMYSAAKAHETLCPNSFILTGDAQISGEKVLQLVCSGDDATVPFEYVLASQIISDIVPIKHDIVNKGMKQFRLFDDLVKIKAKR